jgi:hypothetical protein
VRMLLSAKKVRERMVERKILCRADVRAILGSGIGCLEPRINVRTVVEAVHLMRDSDAAPVRRIDREGA